MAKAQEVAFEYSPRPHFEAFHKRKERFACMVAHRRAGKTVAAVCELIIRALHTEKKYARYAYVAPYYSQAKDVAWEYLKQFTLGFAIKVRESALRVELPNGAWITLYGSDNVDKLRGIYLDGVVIDEVGDCRPSLYSKVIRPCIADREGWVLFIGTPKQHNHFYKIYQLSEKDDEWFSYVLRASESGILSDKELLGMKAQMSEDEYDQEMECSFESATKGTYYADMIKTLELQKRIYPKIVQYNPSLPVKVSADLGRSDSTAFWFWQESEQGFLIIDHYENQGKHLDHYIEILNNKPYHYEELWLPHDAVAKTLATKRSTIEQFLDAGFPCRKVPKLDVQHGIDAARLILPHCFIDMETCFNGVEALRAYSRSYNELTKSFNDKPKHDWASDSADSFRYLALVCKEKVNFRPKKTLAVDGTEDKHPYCLEDLFEDRKSNKVKNNLRLEL